jgi:tetratricopeptide (TPR) repeat protein
MAAEDVLNLADQHLANGDVAAAERVLSAEWRDIRSAPSEAKHSMAMVRAAQQRMGESEELLRSAVADEPQSMRHNIALGHLMMLSNRHQDAAAAYAIAYRVDPQWPGLLANYVTACYGAGRYDEAEKGARLLVTNAPSPVSWDLLSCALRGQGKSQDALDAAQQALALNPNHVGARHSQGAALLALGRVSEALAIFDRLEADGASGAALSYNRATALEKLGRGSDAKALAAETARRWPNAKRPT